MTTWNLFRPVPLVGTGRHACTPEISFELSVKLFAGLRRPSLAVPVTAPNPVAWLPGSSGSICKLRSWEKRKHVKQTNKQTNKQASNQTNKPKKGFEKHEQCATVWGSMSCSFPIFLGWKFQHLKPPPSYIYVYIYIYISSRWASSPVIHVVNNRYKWPYKLGIMSSHLQLGGGPSSSFIYPGSLFKQVMARWDQRSLGFPTERRTKWLNAPLENSYFHLKRDYFERKWNIWSNHQFPGQNCEFSGANSYFLQQI